MQAFAKVVATFFYSGLLPKMPGTWGSLAALPFAWFLWLLPLPLAWTLFVAATALGIWAAGSYCRSTGRADDQRIVIDEVLGIFLTASVAPHTPLAYAFVFFFFRLFDIWKPFPVRWIDRKVKGGLGVVADDLAAALWAVLVVWALNRWWWMA